MADWHHVISPVHHASPIIPTTPSPPRQPLLPIQLFPPITPPRRVLSPYGYLNLADRSPDMFSSITPRTISLTARNDLFPDSESTLSPSLLQLPRFRPKSEHNILITADILNTTVRSGDDQPDAMEWVDDGNDNEMNIHMDIYESWGSDYEEMNDLIIKKNNK